MVQMITAHTMGKLGDPWICAQQKIEWGLADYAGNPGAIAAPGWRTDCPARCPILTVVITR
jgi:hypothetical protein